MSRATASMAAGTLLSRVTGFARVAALGYALGIHGVADAYNLANTTPNIVYDLVLGGVIAATLVPVFVERLARQSRREAWRGISAVLSLAVVLLVAATIAFVALAPWVIRLYTLARHGAVVADQRAEATFLLRLFAPQILLYGLISLTTALLNARRRFATPMFVPIANNLVVIGILLGLHSAVSQPSLAGIRHDTPYLLALGAGTTVGVLAQALALVPSLLRSGVRIRWRWEPGHEAVRTIVRLSGWTFGFVAANQAALFVVLALAAHGPPGDVSAYTYGFTFMQLPFGIVAVSIMSGIQPEMAERWATGDRSGFRRHVAAGLRATLSAVIPAAVGYIVLARPIVTLVLGHGASAGQVLPTARVLTYLSLGLPGYCAYLFLMRAYQAMQDTRSAFYLYLVENGLNVVLALALFGPLGVRGLALSLSVAYTAAAVAAAVHLRGKAGGMDAALLLRPVARSLGASVIMGAVAAVAAALVGSDHGLGLLLRVAVAVASGVTVFVVGVGLAAELAARRRA